LHWFKVKEPLDPLLCYYSKVRQRRCAMSFYGVVV
jgi:hypothetical protein